MKKSDVQTSYHQGCQGLPMINVKCYHFPGAYDVQKHFPGASEAQLERAVEWAWNSSCRMFWEDAQETAKEVFGDVKVFSEGRSGGWLLVTGLPDVEEWNAPLVKKWEKFSRLIKESIAEHCKVENVADVIESNRWHEKGAEEWNFTDAGQETHCIVDLKASAAAKLSPAERKLFNL